MLHANESIKIQMVYEGKVTQERTSDHHNRSSGHNETSTEIRKLKSGLLLER